jgi:hypothetical protein
MSCCGEKRSQFYATNMMYQVHRATVSATSPTEMTKRFVICFEYIGKTGLTVQGPVSGRRYRFACQGARIAVDPRDRPSLLLVPNLRPC